MVMVIAVVSGHVMVQNGHFMLQVTWRPRRTTFIEAFGNSSPGIGGFPMPVPSL
jgi:hypothetical protein